MAAFATATDMIARYDSRTLGDLVADDGARVPEGALASDSKMTAALNSATGELKAALLQGERYTVTELESLTAESQAFLVDLTCRVAFWRLWSRKPYSQSFDGVRQVAKSEYTDALEMLRTGAHVFELDDQIQAGHPKVDTITRAEIREHNLVVDIARNGRFYPRRRTYGDR